MKFLEAFLAEEVTRDQTGVEEIRNIIHGHFGPKELPWTALLNFVVLFEAEIASSFTLSATVCAVARPDYPLFFRNVMIPVRFSPQRISVPLGPVELSEPGLYVFRAETLDDSISITAALAKSEGR